MVEVLLNLLIQPKQVLPPRVTVDLGVIVIKEYPTFPRFEDWSLTIKCPLVLYSEDGFKYFYLIQIFYLIVIMFAHSLKCSKYYYLSAIVSRPRSSNTFKIR